MTKDEIETTAPKLYCKSNLADRQTSKLFGIELLHEFNRSQHPELREGEIFAGNVYEWRKQEHKEEGKDVKSGDYFGTYVYVAGIGFRSKTLRIGEEAYDGYGERLDNFRPSFIQKAELEREQFERNNLDQF